MKKSFEVFGEDVVVLVSPKVIYCLQLFYISFPLSPFASFPNAVADERYKGERYMVRQKTATGKEGIFLLRAYRLRDKERRIRGK